MLSVDSTLFALDWDQHGELDQDDRQTLLNLLTEGHHEKSPLPRLEKPTGLDSPSLRLTFS